MLEKAKSGILASLIILSMILTYRVWFGVPPTGTVRMTGYEYLSFAEPYSAEDIVVPSEVVVILGTEGEEQPEEGYVFRLGEEEHRLLWAEGAAILKSLEAQEMTWASPWEKDALRAEKGGSLLISFRFSAALPIAFLVPELASLALEVLRVDFVLREDHCLILLEGSDMFSGIVAAEDVFSGLGDGTWDGVFREGLNLHVRLPDVMMLNLDRYSLYVHEDGGLAADEKDLQEYEGSDGRYFALTLKDKADLWVPAGDLSATEILVVMEDVDRDRLVKALFFDPSIARRIEERDGAVFFTDGEKGLRVYPDGIIEYTAPKLEQSSLTISYSSALQKGAENLDFFGGWFPETYLIRVEALQQGYQLYWENCFLGFLLQGENVGSEMMINENGVFFYQRNFYSFLEETGDRKSFRSFEEALYRAASIYNEFTRRDEGVLLGVEPVYYLSPVGEKSAAAIPAWSVSLEGMEKIYLHWQTLEPLPR